MVITLITEDKDKLAIDLLRKWWITGTQAFVDYTSSEKALKALRPYYLHNGRVAALTLRNFLGLEGEGGVGIGSLIAYGNYIITRGEITSRLSNEGGFYSCSGCQTYGANPEICLCFCEYAGNGIAEGINNEFHQEMIQNLARGYPECKWILHKTGQHYQESQPELVLNSKDLKIKQKDADYWAKVTLGEYWSIVTKAFFETSGNIAAQAILTSHLQESGRDFGNNHLIEMNFEKQGIKPVSWAIADILTGFGIVFQMQSDDNCISEIIISECPFSGQPEICTQFEAFFKGICESVNPDLVFSYDRMMTKGDRTCHWVIKKKEETGQSHHDKKEVIRSESDPLTILKLRLVKGEITKEEFKEMKSLLE
jgi:hypothetical protein